MKRILVSIITFSIFIIKLSAQFHQEPLPYEFGALEPFIDKETMEIHYTKHHAGYIKNLNDALKSANQSEITDLDAIFEHISQFNTTIRNNAGGHYNHTFFWNILTPKIDGTPAPQLLQAIEKTYGSMADFKILFLKEGMKIFGSGWLWLVVTPDKNVVITTTRNQDNPLMADATIKGVPILAIDSWEHAYYLKYQNRRTDYLEAIWHVINWEKVSELYLDAITQ